jgi:hypothetical protein
MTTMHNRRGASSERGMALIAVLLLLLMISSLGAALAMSGNTETLIAKNQENSAQARAAAEAGLNHALEAAMTELQDYEDNGYATVSPAMSAMLRGPDGMSGSTATNLDNGSLENFGVPRPPTRLQLGGVDGVFYEARVFDEDDPARGVTLSAADRTRISEDNQIANDQNSRIVLRAVGYAPGNTTSTVQATIATMTLPAIVTNKSLTISGNPTINGANGSVHSNVNLTVSGSPNISQNATSSGTYTSTGSPTVGGYSGGGYDKLTIPPIRAIDYIGEADFILNANGTMTTVSTGVTANCSPCGNAWAYNPAQGWRITSNNTPTTGTYYVKGKVTISGTPGSASVPAEMSIIAEGSIEITGNCFLQPHSPELLFVTDGDLKLGGTLSANVLEGQMLVHEQLMISGNPVLAGQILVEDAANVSTLVTNNTISGNPTVTYNGIAGTSTIIVSAWRIVQ